MSRHRGSQRRNSGAGDEEEPAVRRSRRSQATQDEDGGAANGGGFGGLNEDEQEELVRRLIRYLLARNAKKRPVRRPDLSKFVLAAIPDVSGKAKLFNAAFERARHELDTMFGVRVVEVFRPVRPSAASSSRRTQTQGTQGEGAPMSKAYIVVSNLPQKLRAENKRDWPQYGFLTVVASVIALTPECRIEQDALYRALERLGVFVRENNGHKQLNGGNVLEMLETTLVNQWYLDREKEDDGWYYKIGPRLWAELEFGDIIMFIEAVYKEGGNETAGLDEIAREDLKRRLESAMGECLGVGDE